MEGKYRTSWYSWELYCCVQTASGSHQSTLHWKLKWPFSSLAPRACAREFVDPIDLSTPPPSGPYKRSRCGRSTYKIPLEMGSFFSRLRGSSSGGSGDSARPSRVNEQDKAILVSTNTNETSGEYKLCTTASVGSQELKVQRDKLKQYQKKVRVQVQLHNPAC